MNPASPVVRRKRSWRWKRLLLGSLACAGVYAAALAASTPSVAWLSFANPEQTRYMEQTAARSSTPRAATIHWVPLDSISVLLSCAVVKAEDRRFFVHPGVDWPQVGRGLRRSFQGEGVMGGSSITQQLARNLFLSPERTLTRKLREVLIARKLESTLTKPRILEVYLNVIEWGDSEWGAESASRRYFGKPAGHLDAFEATFLAGLVAAPRAEVRGRNADRVRRVQSRTLVQLYGSGLLSHEETLSALDRVDMTYRLLQRGVPLDSVLRGTPEPGRTRPRGSPHFRLPARADTRPLPTERALIDQCGFEREQQAGAAAGEQQPQHTSPIPE